MTPSRITRSASDRREDSRGPSSAHLSDDALLDRYADLNSGAASRADAGHTHLAHCGECRDRFETLSRSLDRIAELAIQGADDIFTPERLEQQRLSIMTRIEQTQASGRVLTFPPQADSSDARRTLRRWVSIAAAAGLLIGLGAGRMLDLLTPGRQPERRAVQQLSPRMSPQAAVLNASLTEEEAFLGEVDVALSGLRVRELRAIDELTPAAGARIDRRR